MGPRDFESHAGALIGLNTDFAALAALSDEQLAYALRQIELRLASLRYATSTIGQALARQFEAKRAAALAERERRARRVTS
jgi:hypothetical protein